MSSEPDIQDELETATANLLWELGNALVKCVVFQHVPDSDPNRNHKILGTAGKPFWSVSSFKAEQFVEGEGLTMHDTMIRPVTVCLYSEKSNAERAMADFRRMRTLAMRTLSQRRVNVTDGCVMKATIQPGPRIEGVSWLKSTAFISTFDVMWKTLERFKYRPGL